MCQISFFGRPISKMISFSRVAFAIDNNNLAAGWGARAEVPMRAHGNTVLRYM